MLFTHRVMRLTIASLGLVAALALGGCQLERFFPEEVGAGVARLSVRNGIKLVQLIDLDDQCGFASESVKYGYKQEGELGGHGRVTWTVEGCELDFGASLKEVATDCIGSVTSASGSVKITATRTVEGVLTGNPEQPVIPQTPDAVLLKLNASMKDYEIRLSDRDTAIKFYEGKLDLVVGVHLAQSASLGVCSVPTNDGTIHSLTITDASVHVKNGDSEFDVDTVPLVDIEAQIGAYGEFENYIDGVITVWDTEVNVGADHELDDLYDAKEFRAAYECKEDLRLPVTFDCLPLTPALADGAAKLTVNNTGNFVQAIVADTVCGFASPSVLAAPEIVGEVGKDNGSVTYRIDEPCSLLYPTKQQIAQDCNGKISYAEGSASFTGTMTIRGRLTGNPAQPVIPSSREPAAIAFDVSFDHYKVSDSLSDQSMEVVHGGLTGTMRPRMAQDRLTGACSIATPVVAFDDLTWRSGSEALINSQGNSLRITIDGGTLQAQNGNRGDRENYLAGTLIVDGEQYTIPLAGAPTLDPTYDAARFDAGYACTPNMVIPADDEQCNFHQIIGDGAARLVIQTVGTLASLINKDDNCGFENMLDVLISPTDVQGDPGEMGSMTWHVDDCHLGSDGLSVFSVDCLGGETYLDGFANITSTRTVRGERDEMLYLIDSIIPRDTQSVDLWLEDVELNDLATYGIAAGDSEPLGILTIHEGTLSAFVQPATGERADEDGVFDVPTPVAKLTNVVLRDAHATLESQGMLFDIFIEETNLSATNGAYRGASNAIAGTIMIDGDVVQIGGALNPAFNQSTFDDAYQCTENLAEPL
jgi:hypothetical protein